MNRQLLAAGALIVLLVAVAAALYALLIGDSRTVHPTASPDDHDSSSEPDTGIYVDDDAPLPTGWEQLIAELDRSRAPRRVAICQKLAELRDPAAAPTLASLVVRDSAASVRLAALHALIAVQPDDLGDRLVTFLDHPDGPVRRDTLRGLVTLADAATLRPLLQRMRDRDYQPRWLVIDAVGAMQLEACVPDLARIATGHTQPRQDRIRALGQLGRFPRSPDARAAIEACARDADTDIARIARALQ